MAQYIIRVELQDADEGDYRLLNFGMEVQGFSLTVTSSNRHLYWLPTGEYFRDGPESLDEVYELAKAGAALARKDFSLVVAETSGWKWRGLRRHG